jgi:hypothetical protein
VAEVPAIYQSIQADDEGAALAELIVLAAFVALPALRSQRVEVTYQNVVGGATHTMRMTIPGVRRLSAGVVAKLTRDSNATGRIAEYSVAGVLRHEGFKVPDLTYSGGRGLDIGAYKTIDSPMAMEVKGTTTGRPYSRGLLSKAQQDSLQFVEDSLTNTINAATTPAARKEIATQFRASTRANQNYSRFVADVKVSPGHVDIELHLW